jgi:CheY-like chemotaxis protein
MAKHILVIDDDSDTTHLLGEILGRAGYTVKEENDSKRALQTAKVFEPDVVILDYLMPEVHGGDVAWQLASDPRLRRAKVIICSGISKAEIAVRLPPTRIPILEKPVDSEALLRLIREN